MNLILISICSILKNEAGEYYFKTNGRQTNHLTNILKIDVGGIVKVGVINKGKGEGIITEKNEKFYIIKLLKPLHLEDSKDKFVSIDVVLCTPRPKILSKSLQQLASIGIKKIIILFSEYSNKCYESSKIFKNEEIKNALQLGLEQAMCTKFPEIYIHYSFSSFFMNIQKYGDENTIKVCAHTSDMTKLGSSTNTDTTSGNSISNSNGNDKDNNIQNTTSVENLILNKENGNILLMLGCERGFSNLEIYLIHRMGFFFFNVSEKILKCETALLILIGQLLLLTENVSIRPSKKKMRRCSESGSTHINDSLKNETDKIVYNKIENTNIKQEQCYVQKRNMHIFKNEEMASQIENIPMNEKYSEQIINFINIFLYNLENNQTNKNGLNSNEDSNILKKNTNIIDTLLKKLNSFNSDDKQYFQIVYLSLLLKKIKYKNQISSSFNDIKHIVDEDGVFIYRTQKYTVKKKNYSTD
ncbi:RNA methyltransferase, putative [Hepatocystis sp. ex Piliocolobus tephrosceles]|nr:RNA methyltransferase, putative [Hepatocystis sp. ex Piliocolobus tephrosceles]